LAAIDSVEHALQHITEQTMIASKKAIASNKTLSVKVNLIHGHDASPSSTTSSGAYGKLSEAISAVYPEAVVSPYIMLAASDSRHYCAICDNVLRFSPVVMTAEERASIHGVDESIAVDMLGRLVEFYIRLISKA
ncbi:MAG TPA: hypothetical protein VLH16_06960, partial [Bacteroidales bacterium]|nr:hypothetical protein [Bacteroidales bacterium]